MVKDIATFIAVVGAMSGISGIFLGWIGRARAAKQELKDDVHRDARISADMEYIKRGVDEVRLEQRAQSKRFDELSERVTRLEEYTKSAHHRIDRMEKGGGRA